MRRLILIISFIFSSQLMAEEVTIKLDRSWGLLIGDQIIARVNLPVNASELDQDSLPQQANSCNYIICWSMCQLKPGNWKHRRIH
tara:strand:- start:165139 stop:165393 length:255 start_codon:yes stop_codon:yes gene_type:complete